MSVNKTGTRIWTTLLLASGLAHAETATPNTGVSAPEVGFWSDLDNTKPPPTVHRFEGRVFVGKAVDTNAARIVGAVQPWPKFPYANWAPRDSDFAVMSSRGTLAVTGLSRSSDAVNGSATISTMGVGGFAVVDREGSTGRGVYSDVQFEKGATYAYGYEAAIKNKGPDATSTPYFLTTGTFGAYLVAGGDASYGGSPANPSNTAVLVAKGASTWNRGIVFGANAITGTDGVSGSGTAIELARGHIIGWRTPENHRGATIFSNVTSANADVSILFQDNEIQLNGSANSKVLRAVNKANATSYLEIGNATADSPVTLKAKGPGRDSNLMIAAQGNGVVQQMSGQVWKRRTITRGTNDDALAGDMSIFWNSTSSGGKTQRLPACSTVTDGQVYLIKDERGDAASNPIDLIPAGGTIEREQRYTISTNRGVARLQCDASASNWNLL